MCVCVCVLDDWHWDCSNLSTSERINHTRLIDVAWFASDKQQDSKVDGIAWNLSELRTNRVIKVMALFSMPAAEAKRLVKNPWKSVRVEQVGRFWAIQASFKASSGPPAPWKKKLRKNPNVSPANCYRIKFIDENNQNWQLLRNKCYLLHSYDIQIIEKIRCILFQ